MRALSGPSTEVIGLVLAAGRSRRFDGDKRRALLPDGRSLLGASIETACQAFAEVWIVLRPDDDAQDLGIPPGVGIVRSELADLGMGHSLAAGIQHLASSRARAVAILLGDMPWIAPASLRTLARAADPQRIVLPWYTGQRGHPVIFGRQFWPALELTRGDQGAKELIKANAALCDSIQLDDPAILRDVDTRADLSQFGADTERGS
ncbi:nucleotidyltransferase family protein [Zestomonas carbonaria]|uniref:Molybdenum cofactor guanylyltransferase n=1 Tax=Zestomonas carbonaria TaxID=2762745 RepID=A0A7U7EK41_9GAMM|nr:nucleotidyltransferase family protein [Pseudomonas carbonaria]CAD5105892.1 Molybdenum cofactor guanylyltransferase [Pseudomonas carbonaria]